MMKKEIIRKRISVALAVIIAAMGVLPHLVFSNSVSAAHLPSEANGAYDFVKYLEPKTFDGSSGANSIVNTLASDLQTEKFTKVVKSTLGSGKAGSYYSKGQAFYIYYVNNIMDYTVFDTFSLMGAKGCFDIWVKTPKAMTFTVKVRNRDDIHATYNVTSTASSELQALRIPVADMTYSEGYNPQNAFNQLTAVSVTPAQSAEGFLAENESIYWGGIELYKSVIPENGKYELKYSLSPNVFDESGFLTAKGVTPEKFEREVNVALNKGKADSYYSKDRELYIYYENKVADRTVFDKLAAMGENGHFSVWLKTPHGMTFTLKLRNGDDVYAAAKIHTAAFNGWQEITVPAAILTFSDGRDLSNAFNKLTGITITPDRDGAGDCFLKEGDAFTVGKIDVYRMTESYKTPDKRFTISPWRDDKTKANGVMTAAMGEVTNAPDGSSDFGKYYSITVGDKFYTVDYGNANRIYMLTNWSADKDFSVLGNKDAFLRLWVKTPHAATFTVKLLDGTYAVKGYATVTTADGKADWQAVDIPVGKLNLTAGGDLTKMLGIVLAPSGSAESFLSAGETFTFGAVDLFAAGGSAIGGSGEDDPPVQTVFPDKRHRINPWRDDKTKADGVMTAASGEVTNAPDGSSDFGKYFSITVGKNFYTLDYSLNYIYMLTTWQGNNDFSVLENEDSYLRIWVKTPHSAIFTITLLDGSYSAVGTATVISADDKTDWQTIDIPVAKLNIADGTDLSKILGIRFSPASSANKFLKENEVFTFGAIDLFKSGGSKVVFPEPPEGPAEFSPSIFLENSAKQYSESGKYTETAGMDFSKAAYWKVTSEDFYGKLSDYCRSIYILAPKSWDKPNYDFSLLKTEGFMRLYYKTEKPATFKLSILDTSYKEQGSIGVTTAAGKEWQYVDVKVTDMTLNEDFDFSQVFAVKMLANDSAEKFVDVNKQIVIGSMYLYKGDKNPSEDMPDFTDLGTLILKPNHSVLFDAAVKNSACSANGISVKEVNANTSLFAKSLRVTMKNSNNYFANTGNITFYTEYRNNINLWDGLKNGYIDIWIKTPHSVTMQLVANKTWPNATVQFTTENGTDWQRVRIPMSKFTDGASAMSYNGFNSLQLRPLTASNFILDEEYFEVGRIIFVCPTTDLGSSGADKTYPIAESELTEYTGSNFKLTASTYQFWSGDPETVKSEYNSIARDNENYFRFTNTQTIWLEESRIDDYYKAGAPIAAMIYLKKETDENGRAYNIDLDPYILTGTVRFYVKVPKKMTFGISLRNGTANNDKSVYVPVTVEPTDENGGFSEVRIPIKKFYDAAVEQNIPFRFDQIDQLGLRAVTPTRQGFLDSGEKLIYSQIEIWTKEAAEPTVPDKTKMFRCSNNDGITVVDKNEVMPETTVINAFRNRAEAGALKTALLKWSGDATYFDALCIRTVSDNSADARLSNPYEPVELNISTEYLYSQGGVNEKNISQIRAVVYDDGSYANVPLTLSDGNISIKTRAMGDYIFYIGTPGKDIEKQRSRTVDNTEDGDGDTNADEGGETDENGGNSGKKIIKKIVKRRKAASSGGEGSKWWLWTSICTGAALLILGGGFLGYKKFFKKALCLFLILTMGLFSLPLVPNAAEAEIRFAELRLAADHPGAPGYDAEYEAIVYYGTEDDSDRLQPDSYTLYTDYSDIKINGSRVTVPASFREKADFDGFKLYVKINSDKEATAYYPIMIKKWNMTVDDNFDGNSLDTTKWTNFPQTYSQLPQDGGKYGQQSYCSADCAKVENGNLVLRVLNGRDGVAYSGNEVIEADFLMPRVTSKFSQQYGCFSADIKFPYGTSAPSNSAFWLLPTTGNWGTNFLVESKSDLSGFSCGEIDIIEYSPAWLNGKFQSAMHWWNNSNFVKYSGRGTEVGGKYAKLMSGEYVNMSCVWTVNSVYVYADGILMRNTKNVEATGELAYVLFTIQTAGYGEEGTGHWLGGTFTEQDVPKMVMYVDSFKAYK